MWAAPRDAHLKHLKQAPWAVKYDELGREGGRGEEGWAAYVMFQLEHKSLHKFTLLVIRPLRKHAYDVLSVDG